MARLVIKFLGTFQVSLEGQPPTGFVSDKGRALLAYLVLEADRPHRRDILAEMLWPNLPSSSGRANLRQNLHRLRLHIGDLGTNTPILLVEPQEVQFSCSSDCSVDAHEFSRSLTTASLHHRAELFLCDVCLKKLMNAIDIYQGDLLAGFSLPKSPQFDWWLITKVEEYHLQAMIMLDRLVIHLKHKGDYSTASHFAQRAIELEPWRERSHRMKMRALALAGNPGAAIRQFETLSKILAIEMGIEPSKKTIDLVDQIRLGRVYSLSNLEGEYPLMEPLAV